LKIILFKLIYIIISNYYINIIYGLLCYEEIKYNYLEETNEYNICYNYFF